MANKTSSSGGFVLSLMTTIHGLLACVVSSIVFVLIIHHQLNNRMKRQDRITLILSANIYLCLFLCLILLISSNTQTLLGDLYEHHFDTSLCMIHGYFSLVVICTLYYGFVVQGFYRLCRIVYFTHRYLQVFWLYLFAVPIQFLISCVLLYPLVFWHYLTYLPTERYCFVFISNILGMLWMTIFMYGFPVLCLSLMYLKILNHVRQQSHTQMLMIKRSQARDIQIMRRVIIIVGILFMLGVPSLSLLFIYYITGYANPFYYRVIWFSFEFSTLLLSILTIVWTPQLKSIVMKSWQMNRVMTVQASTAEPRP